MRMVKRSKKRILGVVGALLLVLLITPFLPGRATAVKSMENTYALVVTTGNDVGDNVSYFGLEYLDAQGIKHIEYVFPYKGALQDTLRIADGNGDFSGEQALGRGKTDTFFFQPVFEVAEITGLDIYCQGEQGQLYAWEVSGMRIYHVDEVLGVVQNGKDHIVRFNGSQLAAMEERGGNGGETFSWTGNTLFRLRDNNTATHRLIFKTIPYSMDSGYNFVVRMDLADVNGAGFEQLNQAYNAMESLRNANFGEYMAIEIEYMDIHGDARCVTAPVMTSAVTWMLENGIPGDAKIAGFAQQGEQIVFGCTMQDVQQINAVMLYTGSEASALLNRSVAGSEDVSFTGISIYKESAVSAELPDRENSANGPDYYFTGSPLYYYTAASVDGETVSADSTHYVSMRAYENGAMLTPVEATEKYLIEMFAEPSEILRAPSDVLVELEYVDLEGNVRRTEPHSVRAGAKEFYGYWPASAEDFAYVSQINSENGIQFIMEMPQVEHFTGLTVSVPKGSNDWQMAGFRVTRVSTLGKRICTWENVIADGAMSNRKYARDVEGYTIFSMEEKALIQPDNSSSIDFISQSVQKVDDLDWSEFRYAMTYEQCTSNLGLAKVRENYTVEVQVQSGTTSLLDGYGDNGSKNRFYFLLQFENGASGYVLANQQLSADGFRSGCTESFIISTNYDYGELTAVHIIPDDISEASDPYDKLNIAQIRVRRSDNGSISKEWIIQNVGWVGIDYRDEGATGTISGQHGRGETEISRIYPVSYSSYALNMEFRIGTGNYNESGSGGAFYGTIEGTLEYYNKDGKRNQLTFDVVRAMYDYANKTPLYVGEGNMGSTGTPLAVTDNSFMFRENHTDRFVVSVSDVAKLSKLTLNMKSMNGGSLQITNVTASLVMEAGTLGINEQDEYLRQGKTEYLCEDTVDKIPAFDMTLPTGRNIYQEIYFNDHEPIKLDAKDNTWISTVSRVPNSKNDTINVFVYPAEDAMGNFDVDIRAQYTDINGTVLETASKSLKKIKDTEGKTAYSVIGLTATSMSTLNRVFVKAQSRDVVDAYMDHIIVQQVRSGVVINSFYMNCEHRNAETEFYALANNTQVSSSNEQKVYLSFGEDTVKANLVSENRDVAVALRYTTMIGDDQEYTSSYVYITDQQYQALEAGDIVELTFNEPYVQEITGLMIASSGNVKAQVDIACADNYSVDTVTGAKRLLKHFSFPTGVVVQNQVTTMQVSDKATVEVMDIQFVTALADAYLESGTSDPIIMVVGYSDSQGVHRESVITDIRDYVISEGEAFSTGSTTQIRLLLRDIVGVDYLQLMPYDNSYLTTAGWKPSQIAVSVGAEGSVQRVNRSIDEYISEDTQLNLENPITSDMVGGLQVSLANIIVAADVAATNESGFYGNAYRVTSAGNKTLTMTVSSGATVKVNVNVTNSNLGYAAKAEQSGGLKNISELMEDIGGGFILPLPKNTTGQDQVYRIAVNARENEKVLVIIEVTVKAEVIQETPPETQPEATDPSTEATEPSTEATEPSTEATEPSTEATEPSTEATEPSTEATEPSTEATEPSTEATEPSTEATEPTTEETQPSTESTEPAA